MILAFSTPSIASEPHLLPTHITTRTGKTITLQLELATTPETRERGLMERKSLAPADGMAFFFPVVAPQKFWMKNTRIPLDILFVNARGTITAIVTGKPQSETPVGPDTPTATVIEIDGGRAARDGIAVGDTVHYELAVPTLRLAR